MLTKVYTRVKTHEAVNAHILHVFKAQYNFKVICIDYQHFRKHRKAQLNKQTKKGLWLQDTYFDVFFQYFSVFVYFFKTKIWPQHTYYLIFSFKLLQTSFQGIHLCYPVWQPLATCGYLHLHWIKFKSHFKFSFSVTLAIFQVCYSHVWPVATALDSRCRTFPHLRQLYRMVFFYHVPPKIRSTLKVSPS